MDKVQKRAEILAQLSAFSNAHPTMTDDQVTEYEALEVEFDKIDASIKREEAQANRMARLQEPTSEALVIDDVKNGTATADYRNAFDAFLAGGSVADFKANMTVGVDADGGFVVPASYQRTVLAKLHAIGRTRAIANVLGTESTTNIPVEGDAPTFTWVQEGGAYGTTKSTFGNEQIGAWKLGGIIKVSEELLQDNMINFEEYMAGQIAKGIDKAESPAFAVGTGSNQPKGYTVGVASGTSSTTASTTAVTADEWINIFYDLKEEYRANATWRMNDNTLKSLDKLKDGQGNYILGTLADGLTPTLKGRPIVIDNAMADIGAGATFAVFGDFNYYQIADRGNITIQRLNERYADEGYVGFKVTKRVDGKPTLAEAFNAGKNALV